MKLQSVVAVAVFATVVLGASGSSASAATIKKASAKVPTPPPVVNITVQEGDTLTKIATDNGTTYVRLYDANTQINDPDLINPNDVIRIPAVDEQLPERPLPENAPPEAVAQAAPAAATPSSYSRPAPAAVSYNSGDVWSSLAACEAGGNWAINTGNGFYGGLQFTLSSWAAVGGSGYPNEASPAEQIARGQMLQARQGWGAWPACSAKLGLR
jgi:LysM repeat protein